MKLIELHILQSFPVSCLNRDDLGSPKTAVFGGATRARVSSQCLKRAARLAARELSPTFQGVRSRFIKEPFLDALKAAGLAEAQAEEHAKALCEIFSKIDKDPAQVTTAVYLSPGEITQIAEAVAAGEDSKKAVKKVVRLDAADIALFGRMVANDPSLNIEGASMFSHALSTHAAVNEIDFFSAVDDRKVDAADAGAGMIGTLEYTSATYYRYSAINLDLLFDEKHLSRLDPTERKAVVKAFLSAVLTAVPGARRNSMNAATLPYEVLGIVKTSGQPLQLVNAFEKPARANGQGLNEVSLKALKEELAKIKQVWNPQHAEEVWLTEAGLDAFTTKILSHVE